MLNLQFAIKDSGRVLLLSDGITKVLHPFEAAGALVHRVVI